MAHIDPTTGSWEPDEDGPAPAQAGLIGEQAAPVPAPAPLPVTPPPTLPSVQLPEPQLGAPGAPAPPRAPPGVPDVQPYQPQAPQLPGVDRVVSPAERATLEAQDANVGARATTEQQGGELDKAGAQAKLEGAQREQQILERQATEQQRIQDEATKRIQAAQAHADSAWEEHRKLGLADPSAGESFGHRLLAAIAIGLGQYSAGINGGPNRAYEIIHTAAQENEARKKAQIQDKLKEAERLDKNVDQARADAARESIAVTNQTSATLSAAAAKMRTELARIGVPAAQIAANADIQKLEAESLQKREQVNESIRKDETVLAKEDIAASVRRARLMRGGGGGGATTALEKFAEAAGALKPGDPIPPEVAVLGRQAGLKPNQIAAEVDRYRGSGAKAAALEGRSDTQTSKEADAWSKENNLAGIIKKQDELAAIQDELKNAPHNPLAQALAVEKAVSSARGGAASKQALALALQHLGGKFDSLEAVIQGARSGELGQKQMDNFLGFLNSQLGTAQKEGKDKYDAFTKYADTLPTEQRARALQSRSRLFSGMAGFGASEGGPQQKAAASVSNGERAQAIQWARANPNDPRAKKILDALGQ